MTQVLNSNNFDQETANGIVLIDFYADWCNPCKLVAPIIDQLSQEVTDAKIVKLDTEESPDIAARFKIRSIPTFIILKDGVEVSKQVGAIFDKNIFIKLIENSK